MTGLWLSQEELDRLSQLVANLKYIEALPIIQVLQAAHQRGTTRQSRTMTPPDAATPPRPEVHPYPGNAVHGHFPDAIDRA